MRAEGQKPRTHGERKRVVPWVNWARRARQEAPELPEYEASVGANLKVLQTHEVLSEGDPRKIAAVVVQLANSASASRHDAGYGTTWFSMFSSLRGFWVYGNGVVGRS
jgi:hypothetical protein